METKPGEEHRKLEKLAGTWTGDETLHPSPWDPGGPSKGRLTARVDLDGFFLITDYVSERGRRVGYRGHGVFGWDASQGMYTMHWFDSVGIPAGGPGLGRWEGDTLQFLQQNPMGHRRTTYRLEGAGLAFRIDFSRDGERWTPFMEATYTRA